MNNRVPSFSFSQRAIRFSNLHTSNIYKAQKQISSGLRFDRASEEPIAFRQVASLNSRYTELVADKTAIERSASILNASVVQIQEFSDVITRAKLITQQGIQAIDDDERTSYAIELEGLLEQLKNISQAQFNDRYLYGGTRSQEPPFEFEESFSGNMPMLNAIYKGSTQRSRASVGDSITVDTYYNGAEVFGRPGREATLIKGTTGAKPGNGTDTLVGQASLLVSHDQTTYQGGSGVAPGDSSAAEDSVIGPLGVHTLTIVDTAGDGSAGTVSLNGGQAIEFTNLDTNLKIPGIDGRVVFVNTTNITAGFNGTIDLESTGILSVDGGTTSIAIDYSANQVVVDSVTGNAVTIDSQSIRQTGADNVIFPGTTDPFQVLFDLSNDLRNPSDLSAQDLADLLDLRLGELESIADGVFRAMGEQSTALQTLDSLGARVNNLIAATETQVSETQATDLPEAVLQLENSEALLQYTYAVTAQLTSISLLDFLR